MRAAYVEELGPVENIRYGELPDPVPGPDEVLVRVEAVAVDPVDTFVRSGSFRTEVPLPLVLGRDLVGTRVDNGKRVWCNSLGHDGRQGASAELAAVPADRLYPAPEGVDPVALVALLHPAATAYLALTRHARLTRDETVFVGGGNGDVGACLIRLARSLGARVVASARGEEAQRYARELGADQADESLPPSPVDVVVDTTGHLALADAVDAVGIRGRVVLMSGLGRTEPLSTDFYARDVSILGFVISHATVQDLAAAAEAVNGLAGDGLRLPVADVLPLERAQEAHRRMEHGEIGRVGAAHARLVLAP